MMPELCARNLHKTLLMLLARCYPLQLLVLLVLLVFLSFTTDWQFALMSTPKTEHSGKLPVSVSEEAAAL